MVAVVSSH